MPKTKEERRSRSFHMVTFCFALQFCAWSSLSAWSIPHLIYWLGLYSSSEIQSSKPPLWEDLPAPGLSWLVHLRTPTSVLCTALSRPHLCIRQWSPCRIHVLFISAPSMLSTQEKLNKCEKEKRDGGTMQWWYTRGSKYAFPSPCRLFQEARAHTHTHAVLLGSTL